MFWMVFVILLIAIASFITIVGIGSCLLKAMDRLGDLSAQLEVLMLQNKRDSNET